MKKNLFLAIAAVLLITSCAKEEPITTVDSFVINIDMPEDFPETAKFNGKVELTNTTTKEVLSTEAVDGVATFKSVLFGSYNATVAYTMDNKTFKGLAPELATNITQPITLNGYTKGIEIVDVTSTAAKSELDLNWSVQNSLLFSRLYIFGTKTIEEKVYNVDKYFEIYNNSSEPQSLDEVYLGEATGMIGGMAEPQLMKNDPSSVYIVSAVGFPKGTTIPPYESIVVAQNAKNHIDNALVTQTVDLSSADFECYVEGKTFAFPSDNVNVPNMRQAFYGSENQAKFAVAQGCALVLFKMDDATFESAAKNTVVTPETESYIGTAWEMAVTYTMKVKGQQILDAADPFNALMAENRRAKRIPYSFDASSYGVKMTSGEIAVRKALYTTIDEETVLQDSNNSANDFEIKSPSSPGANDHLTIKK